MAKTIITAALTGAVTPADINSIPQTPQQIAEDAYKCWKAGAAIVHLHMRDDEGLGTMDAKKFEETIKLIRAHKDCDVIINCTSSGDARVSGGDPEGNAIRMHHHRTLSGIEMGSYDAGSMNWLPGVFINSPAFLEELGNLYIERGIKPEIEIFDAGMLGTVAYYIKKGSIKPPCHFQFCLGVLGGMPATVDSLVYLQQRIPEGSTWSAFGVGKGHLPILFASLAMGGHIRVGLEDNVYFSKGVKATNLMLVERAVQAVKLYGNDPATPSQARDILSIPQLVR